MRAIDKAREAGVPIRQYGDDYRVPCPKCSPTRKKKKDPCLHVTIGADWVKWFCHHCEEFKGEEHDDDELRRRQSSAPRRSAPLRQRTARGW